MKPPHDYHGPANVHVPWGYIDITSLDTKGRHGIAGPDHPYYRSRGVIAAVVQRELGLSADAAVKLADKILEAL